MLHYEVTIRVRTDLISAWEDYLPGHTAEVMATGCFESAAIDRGGLGEYRCRYVAASQAMLDRYLLEFASALRADATGRFPEGVDTSRAVWTEWRAITR
jgi:hypothetical protein